MRFSGTLCLIHQCLFPQSSVFYFPQHLGYAGLPMGSPQEANFPRSCSLMECGWWRRRSVPPKNKDIGPDTWFGVMWFGLLEKALCVFGLAHRGFGDYKFVMLQLCALETECPLKLVEKLINGSSIPVQFDSLSTRAHRKESLTCLIPCPVGLTESTCDSSILGLFTLEGSLWSPFNLLFDTSVSIWICSFH